jgi:hypothetical protein
VDRIERPQVRFGQRRSRATNDRVHFQSIETRQGCRNGRQCFRGNPSNRAGDLHFGHN